MAPASLAIDRRLTLTVNGSNQRVRLCAEHTGLTPLLVVQAGPGLPLLHEVAKFRRRLHLERDFLVCYWEQRGCGAATCRDAERVSFQQQIDDLRFVLRWLHQETTQAVIVLAISLGAAFALPAVAAEPGAVKSLVVVSPDAQTAWSDASASAFLQEQGLRAGNRRLTRRIAALGKPPYLKPSEIQKRASLLIDLGAIERGKTFGALLREMLVGMLRTYGVVGTVKALRNVNLIQTRMLPEAAALDLLANPPRVAVPVHYVFGEQDVLSPARIVEGLPAAIAAPGTTVRLVPNAGHMVHFDRPDVVRSIVVNA